MRTRKPNVVLLLAVLVLIISVGSMMFQKSKPAPVKHVAQSVETNNVQNNDAATKSEEPAKQPTVSYSYVLNTNTKRIHKPTCSSVNEMNPNNRQPTNRSIEQLEAEGYVKCKRCF